MRRTDSLYHLKANPDYGIIGGTTGERILGQAKTNASGRGRNKVAITVNLRYTGTGGDARAFAEEMISSGTVDRIRTEEGNLRYEYYISMEDPETVLLIDSWTDQAAIDAHHASPMMAIIASLREKYDLHMTVERFVSIQEKETDKSFIRR